MRRTIRPLLAAASVLVAGLPVGLGALAPSPIAPAAAAAGVDLTCSLALTKTDPDTINLAYPDEAADYYSVVFPNLPGMRLRITGQFPHARYISFNVYDPQLRPIDAIADVEMAPDRGSRNPFEAGARRGAKARTYTAYVDFGAAPDRRRDRAPNTIYSGEMADGTPLPGSGLIYRIYTPDRGRDDFGDVPIPTVTLERTGSTDPVTPSMCEQLTKPTITFLTELTQAGEVLPEPVDSALPFGYETPRWRRFENLPAAVADNALENPTLEQVRPLLDPLTPYFGQGGFLSNIHNSYVYAATNRAYGKVLVTRFRTPTFPDTRDGARRMDAAQVRYWSICQTEFYSQRYIACRQDDQVVSRRGWATVVVSTPGQRPSRATRRCGVTWMPWGPVPEGALLLRHMLPADDFEQTVAVAEYRKERRTMKGYLPRSTYYADAEDFDANAALRCR